MRVAQQRRRRLAYNSDMRWCSVLSHATTADAAVAEVSERLDRILGGASPNVLWAFVSPAFESGYEVIHDALSEAFPSAVIVGCSGAGVLADGTEVERQAPALAAMAAVLPGVETTVRHFETSSFPEAEDAPGWHRLLGVEPSDSLAFILLPDPFTCDVEHLIAAMDHAYPDAPKVGGLVSGGSSPGEHVLYVGRARHNRGVTVVAMQGNLSVRSVVAQGCRPVGDPMLVTRCQDNVIFELNQKKPAEVLQALAEQLDASVFSRHGFFLGIEMRDQREYRPGDFLVRNLLGVDKSTGGLVVGASIKQFQAVQFHVFDRQAAAMDLSAQLEREASEHGSVAGALLFSCLGRGEGLFNVPDHDSTQVRQHLEAPALAGFFCNGEIGPVGGRTFVHGYTSAVALFRPADR